VKIVCIQNAFILISICIPCLINLQVLIFSSNSHSPLHSVTCSQEEQRWLDLGLGLREQSIGEDSVLILRKKYFYSDQVRKMCRLEIVVCFFLYM
jgi:hypothetical protein